MCAQTSDPPGTSQQVAPVAALDQFLAVQAQRAQHYRRFDEAHRAYLRTKAEGPYRYVMTQLTEQFNECSQQVITLERALAGPLGQPAAAELLREVQQQEREKLRLTLSLQALKAAYAHQRFSWQQSEDGGAVGWPGHICGAGCSHPEGEPTQAEYEGAVRESYQQLQAAVSTINAAIEEIRQLRADLATDDEAGNEEGMDQ